MEILVCIKRVPGSGAEVRVTDDGGAIDTRHLSFTIGPHEECAIEEAVRIVSRSGGSVTVLTVGDTPSDEQLRYALSMGAHRAVRVATPMPSPGPEATSTAIVHALRELESDGQTFDLILFGNESADSGNFQVGVRVAHALDMPFVGAVKGIELGDTRLIRLSRPVASGVDVYEAGMPAVVAVKEGLNLPRYPSMPGRLRAKKADIRVISAFVRENGLKTVGLRVPAEQPHETAVLGIGRAAAPAVTDLLEELL